MTSRNTGVSVREYLDAVLANDLLYKLGELVPTNDRERGGRPRDYPGWAYILFVTLITIYRSARRVETELAYPGTWEYIRRAVAERFPNDPSLWLPAKPMARHHWRYGRDTYLQRSDVWDQLKTLFIEQSARQATSLGLCSEGGDGSLTHPSLDRMLHADGKVVTPLFKAKPGTVAVDKKTGEIRTVRHDPDAGLFVTGGGEAAYGNKFVLIGTRTQAVHGRMILNFGGAHETPGEARAAVDLLKELATHVPGAQGVIYDGAFRGKHLQELLHDAGLLPVTPVTSKSGGRRSRKPRVERVAGLERRSVDGRNVELHTEGGVLGIFDVTERGEREFVPLQRRKVARRPLADGTFRWYQTYDLPEHLGGGSVMVRLDITEKDRARGLNRTEILRAIPPGDGDYHRLFPRRSDIESINRALDDTLWLGRAHSVGLARQLVDLLGFALVTNSLALFRHGRAAPPIPVAA